MNENPTVRIICNLIATIAFLAALVYMAQNQIISRESIERLMLAFTIGTTLVKAPKALLGVVGKLLQEAASTGQSQRMQAVKQPPNEPPIAGGRYDHTTTQVPTQRHSEPGRYGGPMKRALERASDAFRWGPSLLAAALALVLVALFLAQQSTPALAATVLP